ncbi:MAG: hypothetical protein R3C14_05890 [Caldilineaceae bacterium]
MVGGAWVQEAEETLAHNVRGDLLMVTHPSGIGNTTMSYDLAGHKLTMTDPDLGPWSYAYDCQGKLTRRGPFEHDARSKTICLYDDSYQWLAGKHFRADTSCPSSPTYDVSYGYDQNHSSSNRSRGQLTYVSTGSYSKWLYYNSVGLLAQEQVNITGAPITYYNTYYGYDSYLRPSTVTYPGNEVVTTTYNSMGLPNRLTTSLSTTPLVDGTASGGGITTGVAYDEAGRLTQMRFPLGGNLWHTRPYRPWTGSDGNSNGRSGRSE